MVLAMAGTASAQLKVLPQSYWASAVNNDGLVAGYFAANSTFALWDPDLSTTNDIGGMSPTAGAGGWAKFSADGKKLSGGAAGTQGSEMATYDRTTGEWTAHGSLGASSDGNASSGWAISGDGGTVVGLAWINAGTAHAVAWNADEGVIDLGAMPDGSSRANAVNGDGSIVVGWMDWKATVWRKNPAGGYFPGTHLLFNPLGNPNSDTNQPGECNTISADGAWIGGYGDYANNDQPWVWSEITGVINLGSMDGMGRGYVSSLSADGSVAVGWFDGQFFGDPRKAFIWTQAGGLQDLNVYATSVLSVSLGSKQLYTASDISPDGRYITGSGVDGFAMIAYRLDVGTTTGLAAHGKEPLNAWPNPVVNTLHFNSAGPAVLTLHSADGKVVYRSQVNGDINVDFSGYLPGVYILELRTESGVRMQRIVKS